MTIGEADGEPVVVILKGTADTWSPYSIVRLNVLRQRIDRVVDYLHCPWVISTVTTLEVTAFG